MKPYYILPFFLCLMGTAEAAETFHFPEIVVTAQRVPTVKKDMPQSMTIITKAIWCYVKRENKKIPKPFVIAFGIWRILKLSLRGPYQRLEND